jgi:hypothetical protein
MAATTLDRKTALIVIDLQKGIVGMPTAHPAAEIVARSAQLADAFRRHSLPVVLVNVAGVAPGRTEQARALGAFPDGWTEIVAELNPQPQDHRVTKRTWGAFTDTGLLDLLRREGVTQAHLGRLHRYGAPRSFAARGRDPGRDRRDLDQRRRRIDCPAGARIRLPRHAGDRRHDRHAPGGARE